MKRSIFLLASLLSVTACNTDPNPAATPEAGSDVAMPVEETTPATDAIPATSTDPNVQTGDAMDGTGSPPNSPVMAPPAGDTLVKPGSNNSAGQ